MLGHVGPDQLFEHAPLAPALRLAQGAELIGQVRRERHAELGGLSARGRAAGNDDLVSEYLLCRRLLGLDGPGLEVETEGLLAAQDGDGHWNGPIDLTGVLHDEGFGDDEMAFFSHYHTTLVGMVAIAGVDPSRRPASPVIEARPDGAVFFVR